MLQVNEPTLEQLSLAWTYTLQSEGIAGAHSDDLIKLKAMRDSKFTWFGKRENDLRIALDKYLSYHFNQRNQ